MRICLNLDGVIAELRRPDQIYSELAPVPSTIEALRRLKQEGQYLILFTAKHMKTYGGKIGAVVARQGLKTFDWLARTGIVVDDVCFGKRYADVYVGDCGLRFSSWADFQADFERLSRCALGEKPPDADPVRVSNSPVLVVSAAGKGSRLARTSFTRPVTATNKALVDVCGRPMMWWSLLSLRDIQLSKIVFVALQEHENAFGITARLREIATDLFAQGLLCETEVVIVLLPQVLNGQLLSVLKARDHFVSGRGLLISSCDTLVASRLASDLSSLQPTDRGLVSVTEAVGEHWSFARVDDQERIVEVAEKRRISNLASTGIYYFADTDEFLAAAHGVITVEPQVQGEYYVIPVYQEYLKKNCVLKISRASAMWDMGQPAALQSFLKQIRQPFLTERFGILNS